MRINESEEGIVKRERSLSVQSRVNVVDLAELDRYFSEQGSQVRTMSQLINWSVGLLVEVLKSNNALPTEFDSLLDAHRYLNIRGLYQPSMMKVNKKKLGTSLRFEGMREKGVDPGKFGSGTSENRAYNTLHGNSKKARPWKEDKGLEPFEGEVKRGMYYQDDINEAFKIIESEKKRELDKNTESYINELKEQSKLPKDETVTVKQGMSEEEFIKRSRERDEEIRRRENAPVDISMFNVVKE